MTGRGSAFDFSPPRSPSRMVGRRQISDFLRRICPADFGISIVGEVIGGDRFAFSVDCAFPDGKHIFENTINPYRRQEGRSSGRRRGWDG